MPLELTIVTPEGERFRGEVETVVLPGTEGDFGVLEGHERFLAPLRIGVVEIRAPGETVYAALSGGFADVAGEEVVVLAETCELAHAIDVARAERARARAERELGRLRESREEEHRFRVHQTALERAVVRISVAQRS